MIRKLLLLLIPLMLFSCKKIEKEDIFILPKSYEGTVLIVFDVPNSTKEEYDSKGRRLYKIPSSGILETEFKANYGVSNLPKFYTKDKYDKLTEVPFLNGDDWDDKKYNHSLVVSTLEVGKDKKDFLSFIVGEFDNDTIGSNRYRQRENYFSNRKF